MRETRKPKRARKHAPVLTVSKKVHARTRESDDIVLAIRKGRVDALVAEGENGDQILTLQGAEHPYRILIETINDGAATLDPDGTVLYANKRFAQILGIAMESFIGTDLQLSVPSAGRQKLLGLITQGLRKKSEGEITLAPGDSGPRLVRFSFNPVQNGNRQNICVVATELTELVKANEALRSNEELLRQLSTRLMQLQDEERRRIARDLHDVTGQKVAVQTIGLMQVLSKDPGVLDGDARRILTECAALTKEVGEEIRTLSYLLHPPLLDELGLSAAVKWYAEGFHRRTGIRTDVSIASDFLRLPPDVEVTLFRVVQESLTNVHRYSGSPKAYVRVSSTRKEVRVEVGDFGRGLSPEMMTPAAGTMAALGVGIQGMKERMRQLAGHLEITSAKNKGTVVTATVPLSSLHVANELESEAAMAALASGVEGQSPDKPSRSRKKRILIADDHEIVRRGVRTLLQNEKDWEICGEAIDGNEALHKAAALRPDLVILDINMPVLNGLAAVRQILRKRPQTKILVFTVHDSEQTKKEITAAGAHGYLSKNKAGQDLLRVVRELLGPKTAAAANAGKH